MLSILLYHASCESGSWVRIFAFFRLCWAFVGVQALSLGCGEQGCALAAVCGLLPAAVSPVAAHVGSVVSAARAQSAGSVVLVHVLSCMWDLPRTVTEPAYSGIGRQILYR